MRVSVGSVTLIMVLVQIQNGGGMVQAFANVFSPNVIRCEMIPLRNLLVIGRTTNSNKRAQSTFTKIASAAQNNELNFDEDGSNRARFRARVAYDGTYFQGFQSQSRVEVRTVQSELQRVMANRFDQPVTVIASGRTDTGVHARGQGMHFEVSLRDVGRMGHQQEPQPQIQYSLNRMLPPDVRIYDLELVHIRPSDLRLNSLAIEEKPWHAMASPCGKLYSYRFTTNHIRDPLQRYARAHVTNPIDINQLREVLQYYVGTHDFRPFAGQVEQNAAKRNVKLKDRNLLNEEMQEGETPELNTVRTIHRIDLVEEHEDRSYDDVATNTGNFRIDFIIDGALYKMIRNLVGTAWEACKLDKATQRITADSLFCMINQLPMGSNVQDNEIVSGDASEQNPTPVVYTRKSNLAKPAPPEGLSLEWVFFNEAELKEALNGEEF